MNTEFYEYLLLVGDRVTRRKLEKFQCQKVSTTRQFEKQPGGAKRPLRSLHGTGLMIICKTFVQSRRGCSSVPVVQQREVSGVIVIGAVE